MASLQAGARVLVKPGERIPADRQVIEGTNSLNDFMISGESIPVSKSQGQAVVGGSVHGEGSLTVEVSRTGNDTFLARITDLVRPSREGKSKGQERADRAAAWLTYLALAVGVLYPLGILLSRAVGAIGISAGTVIVSANAPAEKSRGCHLGLPRGQ